MLLNKLKRNFFYVKQDIQIPNPIGKKILSLGLFIMTFWLSAFGYCKKVKFSLKNIEKQYVINSMTEKACCSVLLLSPYRCILDTLEMTRVSLEFLYKLDIKSRGLNPWRKYIQWKLGLKKRKKFYVLDNEIKTFIIHSSENDDVIDNWDEM